MALLVGVPACSKSIDGEPQHAVGARYAEALTGAAGVVPVLLPPIGETMLAALDHVDGVLLPGSTSNVRPELYGAGCSLTPGNHDAARDDTTMPLIREALARGIPLLAICRGMQELNVALGGTLHQQVHALPGRFDHRADEEGELDYVFRLKHPIHASGQLAAMVGAPSFTVNSLHEQAVARPADGLEVEAVAEDGTIEAVRVRHAKAFALGVQFHPEWFFATDAASRAIFAAFGEACRRHTAGRERAGTRLRAA